MLKLLEINGTSLPDPEKTFSLNKEDKYNEYEGENGERTIEVIRENIISGNVSYKGLTVEKLKEIKNSITLVSTVKIYDPGEDAVKEITAKITGVKYEKKFHRNNVSVWSLSFNIEEL